MEELIQAVETWGEEKGITDSRHIDKQFFKFIEEVFEYHEALDRYLKLSEILDYSRGNPAPLKDKLKENAELEFGDMLVTLIIQAKQLGFNLEECLEKAYNKISKRNGKTIDGVFVKEEDL